MVFMNTIDLANRYSWTAGIQLFTHATRPPRQPTWYRVYAPSGKNSSSWQNGTARVSLMDYVFSHEVYVLLGKPYIYLILTNTRSQLVGHMPVSFLVFPSTYPWSLPPIPGLSIIMTYRSTWRHSQLSFMACKAAVRCCSVRYMSAKPKFGGRSQNGRWRIHRVGAIV